MLSIDGGSSFPFTLASAAPNSGAATISVPNTPTLTARVKVEAVDNIFFNISLPNFTITPNSTAAPTLLTEQAVRGMQPGSVIVDMAADSGGNAEPSKPGETVDVDGVKVIGPPNLPSEMSTHASQLYSKNLENLLGLMIDDEDGSLKLDFSDEVIAGACITHEGEIRNERAAEVAGEFSGGGGEESGDAEDSPDADGETDE